jgi:hypothetical protein
MVNYTESVNFIQAHKDELRAVIMTTLSCRACESIINIFNASTIPFIVVNADSDDLIYKPLVYPQTYLFSNHNICYTRVDVFDSRMFYEWVDKINNWEQEII